MLSTISAEGSNISEIGSPKNQNRIDPSRRSTSELNCCKTFIDNGGHLSGHLIHEHELEIGCVIGRGSYGYVRIGIYSHMQVAIKILQKDWNALSKAEKCGFLEEIRIATQLNKHQNVLRVYGFMKEPHIAIVTEFCENGSVLDYINNPINPRLSSLKKINIAIGITKGLAFIHKNNVIHRDLAARNILLREDVKGFQPRIADFGRARRLKQTAHVAKDPSAGHLTHKTLNCIGPVK